MSPAGLCAALSSSRIRPRRLVVVSAFVRLILDECEPTVRPRWLRMFLHRLGTIFGNIHWISVRSTSVRGRKANRGPCETFRQAVLLLASESVAMMGARTSIPPGIAMVARFTLKLLGRKLIFTTRPRKPGKFGARFRKRGRTWFLPPYLYRLLPTSQRKQKAAVKSNCQIDVGLQGCSEEWH